MRKATLLLALVLTGVAFSLLPAYGAEPALEPTDSGAPSAIVIFPVGEKPNPNAAAMPPVTFNHVIHEKWMSRTNKDCAVCHHTGDPIACTECHTAQGSQKANFVTLETAMHKPEIAKRKDNTPSSCVSCHIQQTKQRDCAGCHEHLVRGARQKDAWCNVCHSTKIDRANLDKGIAGKLSETQNEKIATKTAIERKPTTYWSPMTGPYKVNIDTLANQYEPANFNHRHHVASMMERIEKNELAGVFHNQPGTVCVTCHHNAPATQTPSKCSSCHSKTLDWLTPARPNLMAAFHLQCMSCHKDMKVVRPRNTDCATCHKPRQSADASITGGL